MSLARIAVRLAAVEALKGRTAVGDRVFDSRFGAITTGPDGEVQVQDGEPFIAVYTDTSEITPEPGLERSFFENGATEIVFETGVAEPVLMINQETGEKFFVAGEYQFAATDDMFEFHLDRLMRQAAAALSDPNNAWSEIFRSLIFRVTKVDRRRVATEAGGSRRAAQQLALTANLMPDPVPGDSLDETLPFGRFLAALEAAGDRGADIAALLRAEATGAGEDWEIAQRRIGLTRDELQALGVGPIAADADRTTPEMAEGIIETEGLSEQTVTPDV